MKLSTAPRALITGVDATRVRTAVPIGFDWAALGDVALMRGAGARPAGGDDARPTVEAAAAALLDAMQAREPGALRHAERVAFFAQLTGRALELNEREIQVLADAGLFHDVGKIGVPSHILNKAGPLTEEEMEAVRRHPRLSRDLLAPIPGLAAILNAVLHHHENHDGSGYPHGLAGENIPLAARIIHVVDIFDALTSTRAYRAGYSVAAALGILADGEGAITDPRVTRTFVAAFKRYVAENPEDFAARYCPAADETVCA